MRNQPSMFEDHPAAVAGKGHGRMKILTVVAWLLALAIFCATSAYLVVQGHPYMALIVMCFIYGLKLKIEVE